MCSGGPSHPVTTPAPKLAPILGSLAHLGSAPGAFTSGSAFLVGSQAQILSPLLSSLKYFSCDIPSAGFILPYDPLSTLCPLPVPKSRSVPLLQSE